VAFQNVSKIALDTAPIIYFVEKHPDYLQKMRDIFYRISNRQIVAISTIITLTEVLNHPMKMQATRLIQEYEEILTNSEGFELIPVNHAIARNAARLRANYSLKTPDAIHIATALETKCDLFLTNDFQLKRVTEIQIMVLNDLTL
jgi:predicted nucleic acid-binding protein